MFLCIHANKKDTHQLVRATGVYLKIYITRGPKVGLVQVFTQHIEIKQNNIFFSMVA